MIKIAFGAFGISALLAFSAAASAADLPTMKAAPVAPVVGPYDWAGFYVGAYAGGSFGATSLTDLSFPSFTGYRDLSPSSFTGGLFNGYNMQFNAFVIGAEIEFGYDGRHASGTYDSAARFNPTRDDNIDGSYIGRLRARAGYAFDNVLIYAAGGLSVGDLQARFTNPNDGYSQSVANTLVGYNVGGGVEYAFSRNWIARLEYIYDDFGAKSYKFNITPPTTSLFDTTRVTLNENTVRAGVEYKF